MANASPKDLFWRMITNLKAVIDGSALSATQKAAAYNASVEASEIFDAIWDKWMAAPAPTPVPTPTPTPTPVPTAGAYNGAAVPNTNNAGALVNVGPNSPFKNISDGLAAVNPGGTVVIENGAQFWEAGVYTRVPCTIKAAIAVKDGGAPWVLDCKDTRVGWQKGGILAQFDATISDGVVKNAHLTPGSLGGNAGGICSEASCDNLTLIDMEIHDCDNGLRSIGGNTGNHWNLTRVNVHDCGQGGTMIGASGNTHDVYLMGKLGASVLNATDCKFTASGQAHAFKARWDILNFKNCLFDPSTEGRCVDPCEGGTWAFDSCTFHKGADANQHQVAWFADENQNHGFGGMTFTNCAFNMDRDCVLQNDTTAPVVLTGCTITGNLNLVGNITKN